MHSYARLKPGAGFQFDRALFYYAQRLVTVPAARRAVASMIAAGVRARHGDDAGSIADADRGRVVADLNRDGLAMLPPLASDETIGHMVAYFLDKEVVGRNGQASRLDLLPANTPAAAYPLATVLGCPNIVSLLNDPPILSIAADYIGCKPTLSSIGVRWSFPAQSNATDTQRFHRDVDDWRFLKLFIYLTDVDEGSGPHAYVRTSHKTGFGLRARAYTMDDIEQRYGIENLSRVLGPRGTTFLADTQGVHCGSVPVDRPRLIFQAQYSLLPVFAFDYQPVERAEPSADAYVNRLIIRQRPPATTVH
jgi:hypothetical protein